MREEGHVCWVKVWKLKSGGRLAGSNGLFIQFLGAAQTVTGSKYLLTFNGRSILIDCGLFQGLKALRLQNWEPLPIDASKIDAVLLTHAHLDHSGYIPRLIKEGFRGKIYCTEGTKALAEILLPDTGFLQEEEAEYLNRKKISKHSPALPLYSRAEGEAALNFFETKPFGENFEPISGFRCCFLYVGHILGAASLVISVGNRTIGFSGDVGRPNDAVFYPPASLPPLDYLILESTYGDRLHPTTAPMHELGSIIRSVFENKGVVLIPAFTVGRVQTLLYFLTQLRRQKRIPDCPLYLNSPMANRVTEAFIKFRSLHKLSEEECTEILRSIRVIQSAEESKALNKKKGPMLIISASGMATGGRILYHLKAFASDPRNAIILTGFQAKGTRGEALLNGANEIKIHGQMVPVKAQVHSLENLSAHADYLEIQAWLSECHLNPKKVFLTHGELEAVQAMGHHLNEKLHWNCIVPGPLQQVRLE